MSVRTVSLMPECAHPEPATTTTNARNRLLILHHRLLRTLLEDVELDATVGLATLRRVVGDQRPVGAEALGDQAALVDALVDQVRAHGFGAALRQLAVALGAAGRIGVALDL